MIEAINGIQEPEYDEKIVYMPHDDSAGPDQQGVSCSTSQPAEKPTHLPKLTSQFTRGEGHGKRLPAMSVPKGWYERTDAWAFEVGLLSKGHLWTLEHYLDLNGKYELDLVC